MSAQPDGLAPSAEQGIVCPNPECGRRLPAYATRCKYCDTLINASAEAAPQAAAPAMPAGASRSATAAAARPVRPAPSTNNGRGAFPELVPQPLSGVYNGIVMLTPKSFMSTRAPLPWTPRANVPVNLSQGAMQIHSATIGGTSLGVYRGGLQFPEHCPATMATPNHREFIEAAVVQRGTGKVEFPSASAETLAKIGAALTSDRYWYAVPFAAGHGAKDRALNFAAMIKKGNSNTAVMEMTNRAYAQALVSLNGLQKAKWLDRKHLLMRALGTLLGVVGLGAVVGFVFAEVTGSAVISGTGLYIALGAVVAAAGVGLFIWGERGEPLTPPSQADAPS